MPGQSPRADVWGDLPLVIDTSAFVRAGHAHVRERWQSVLLDDRLRLAPAAKLEILLNARDGPAFDALADRLSQLRPAPMSPAVVRSAEQAMADLAQRSPGAHRIPIVDYLLGAAAQELGCAVIHYDGDFDTLAAVMAFESIWLAPAGELA